MLLDLPRDGDRVEVITSSSHEVRSHTGRGFRPGKTTQDVVVDTMTPSERSDELQRKLGYPDASSTGTTVKDCVALYSGLRTSEVFKTHS
ncbi:hypothetical protein TELCIR_21667 [Teladorsagia circumcincta]|uniref:Uncharacterized protein n=1 Tax=Teladorsagia circumcincta TaxID=45464 RepID=A0A2G9TG43_TELCI|nr:hypothetical protein TELCIR_21667 [Teladorsagia circumcincta]